MQKKSTIALQVELDENKVPEKIFWEAAEGGVATPKEAKAFMLSIWDVNEQAAMRIDLWTKKMMLDEMGDFVFQTMMTMADTYQRATKHDQIAEDMKTYARTLKKKMQEELNKNQS
ncbi:MAG: gliding motility protein GldC [Chitinophagaceae bacterium]